MIFFIFLPPLSLLEINEGSIFSAVSMLFCLRKGLCRIRLGPRRVIAPFSPEGVINRKKSLRLIYTIYIYIKNKGGVISVGKAN